MKKVNLFDITKILLGLALAVMGIWSFCQHNPTIQGFVYDLGILESPQSQPLTSPTEETTLPSKEDDNGEEIVNSESKVNPTHTHTYKVVIVPVKYQLSSGETIVVQKKYFICDCGTMIELEE